MNMLDDLLTTYFEDKGIYAKTNTDINLSGKKSHTYLLEKMLNNNPNSYNILSASGFDLELLQGIDSAKEITDAALANAETAGNIKKDIGGHAMLITDVDENGDLIVSSWSRKYKFLSNSVEEAKNNGRISEAIIWNLEFMPKD